MGTVFASSRELSQPIGTSPSRSMQSVISPYLIVVDLFLTYSSHRSRFFGHTNPNLISVACAIFDQNNEPLMRALSKLINENEPELVLFVGEALVGNDGVNQLQMFNQVRSRTFTIAHYCPRHGTFFTGSCHFP